MANDNQNPQSALFADKTPEERQQLEQAVQTAIQDNGLAPQQGEAVNDNSLRASNTPNVAAPKEAPRPPAVGLNPDARTSVSNPGHNPSPANQFSATLPEASPTLSLSMANQFSAAPPEPSKAATQELSTPQLEQDMEIGA